MAVTAQSLPNIQRDEILKQQQNLAKQYEQNLPQTINEQYEAAASPINRQYGQARKNLVSSLNSRGMVNSGKARTGLAQVEADRYGALSQARGDTARSANDRLLALQTDPINQYSNMADQNQSYAQQLQNIENQRNQLSQQLMSQSLGLAGQAAGMGLANVGAGNNFFYNPAAKK